MLTTIFFSLRQVNNIIKKLGPKTAHEHDKISIHMLKLCENLINKPLATTFKTVLIKEYFQKMEKSKCSTKLKKKDKKIVKIYRSDFLLPFYNKIIERIIYNTM